MHLAPNKTFVNRLKGAKFYCLLPVLNKYDFASFPEIHFCAIAIVSIFFDLEAFLLTLAVFAFLWGRCMCGLHVPFSIFRFGFPKECTSAGIAERGGKRAESELYS